MEFYLFLPKSYPMDISIKFPVTWAEREALGEAEVRFPAGWDDYYDLLEECEYPIEYQNGEIIAMSHASDPHETVVFNLNGILYNILQELSGYRGYPSNRRVFLENTAAEYNADGFVVKGEPVTHKIRKGTTGVTNPFLVIEVLSPSTREKDLSEKLPRYKKTPSIRHILYIEQDRPFITIYDRIGDSPRWETVDYDSLEQAVPVLGTMVPMQKIYENVVMGG